MVLQHIELFRCVLSSCGMAEKHLGHPAVIKASSTEVYKTGMEPLQGIQKEVLAGIGFDIPNGLC